MKKLVVSIVSAAALATSGMAAAGGSTVAYDHHSDSNSNPAGIYVAGDLGYGTVNAVNSDYPVQPTSIKTGGFAWDANAGYQFNRYLAIEAGYISFGQAKANYGTTGTLTSALAGFDADVKGILPISNQFDLFAKAGAVDMHESLSGEPQANKANGSAWTPMFGLGTSYNVNHNVALNLQDIYALKTSYSKTINGVSGTVHVPAGNAVLAGVSYKFSL
ncbi:MAG: hypothetical protein A3C44_07915 [Gammaproteobacteria bacterium RIFCSPHIGHO2_02_FULL_39_13]|nr:MAG: hypothetical protein A3C44_07915 [Gammaproteobacteria bacterium RIFCSPHIGHO2_02_FULL_39_13]OGT49190.1 MAG: hypothetical protein A3E53_06945 [Gammaproteobacteria bacterium RIFCSPHIGHO2_12_FULL_39_24]